ncbi:hypothetical protein GNF85_24285 [Clostridium perfringens]
MDQPGCRHLSFAADPFSSPVRQGESELGFLAVGCKCVAMCKGVDCSI